MDRQEGDPSEERIAGNNCLAGVAAMTDMPPL